MNTKFHISRGKILSWFFTPVIFEFRNAPTFSVGDTFDKKFDRKSIPFRVKVKHRHTDADGVLHIHCTSWRIPKNREREIITW